MFMCILQWLTCGWKIMIMVHVYNDWPRINLQWFHFIYDEFISLWYNCFHVFMNVIRLWEIMKNKWSNELYMKKKNGWMLIETNVIFFIWSRMKLTRMLQIDGSIKYVQAMYLIGIKFMIDLLVPEVAKSLRLFNFKSIIFVFNYP